MSTNSPLDQVSILSAKMTALTMLVETIWVGKLAAEDDPREAARHIIDDLFKTDEIVRERTGESAYSLLISETISSLIDRACARAAALKGGESRQK